MQILVDPYSTGWVHYSFNSAFLGNQQAVTANFIGVESSLAFQEYQGEKYPVRRHTLSLVLQIILASRACRTRNVVFLAMTSREVTALLLLRLLGFRVEYVMHKLNLRCRILRLHWKVIFRILDSLGVNALCFEPPHPLFQKYRLLSFSPYALTRVRRPIAPSRQFGRIAFIGRPDEGKQYEIIEAIAGELGFEIIVFTDEALPPKYKTKSHTFCVDECDVIWGYYDPNHYQGIQSGLPYVAIESGLMIITNNNIGFGAFSEIYPDYCISCRDSGEIKAVLCNTNSFSSLPND